MLTVTAQEIKKEIIAGGILYDIEKNKQLDLWISQKEPINYPYIRTFLFLRNKKPLLQVINKFRYFDFLMVEGAGRQHPRNFGLACELGVELDVPTIGITKSSLVGEIDFSQPIRKEGHNIEIYPVFYDKTLVAYFLKQNKNKKGVFLSIGNKITLQSATDIVLPLLLYRLPEPLRIIKSLLKKKLK